MAGLQYIVKSNLAGKIFTLEDVEEAGDSRISILAGTQNVSITKAGRVCTRSMAGCCRYESKRQKKDQC
jgi:hypothetical protein